MSKPLRALRCFIKKESTQYVAVCVDLNLAIQTDTAGRAKCKLENMIRSYLHEAVTVHKVYSDQLLYRNAPLSIMLEYYHLKLKLLWRCLLKETSNEEQSFTIFEQNMDDRLRMQVDR